MGANKSNNPDIYTSSDILDLAISQTEAGRLANKHSVAIGRPVATLHIEETMSADEMADTLNMDSEYARKLNAGIYIVEMESGFAFAY